ncbi:33926_t:CDS:2, partial [Racocetra persica]
QKEDPTMFIQPLINTDNIILHDNTSRTNKYNFPLSLFILIDNDGKSQLVVQAFLSDETQESYKWVLQQTLDATGSEPQVIMIDMDPAMDAACQVKYMNSYHIHCIWHMSQNLSKRLKAKLRSENFKEFICDFWKVQNSLNIEVFEYRFQSLLEKYPTGMQSTSRVESINAIIHKAVAFSSSMSDVVEALELRMQREELNKKINKQMCELVLYKCEKLDIDHALEDQLYLDENELINKITENIEDFYDYQQLCLKELLKSVSKERCVDLIYDELFISTSSLQYQGYFKKVLSYSMEDDDQNALDELILDYIAKKEEIQNIQTQLVSVEESQAYDNIKDPVVRRSKGRSPNKWLKAFNEETNKISSNKKQQDTADSDGETRRRYRLYHKSGHYASKYPNKENAMSSSSTSTGINLPVLTIDVFGLVIDRPVVASANILAIVAAGILAVVTASMLVVVTAGMLVVIAAGMLVVVIAGMLAVVTTGMLVVVVASVLAVVAVVVLMVVAAVVLVVVA